MKMMKGVRNSRQRAFHEYSSDTFHHFHNCFGLKEIHNNLGIKEMNASNINIIAFLGWNKKETKAL